MILQKTEYHGQKNDFWGVRQWAARLPEKKMGNFDFPKSAFQLKTDKRISVSLSCWGSLVVTTTVPRKKLSDHAILCATRAVLAGWLKRR